MCRSELANAQTTSRAVQLFDAGVAELKLGNYETACPSLQESYGLDANLGTLIALGDCLERWGKPRSAATRFAELVEALSSANARTSKYRAHQLEYARVALARLSPTIPRLRLTFSTTIDAGVRIFLDGERLKTSPPEQEVSLDPGHHVLITEAAGHEPWRLELDLNAGEQRSVALERGRASVSELPPPPEVVTPASALPPEPRFEAATVVDASETTTHWRTLGWGLAGLGVVGVATGAVSGVMVLRECPSFDCGSDSQRGKDLALLTDVAFGVGIGALAASALVLLSTPPEPKSAAHSSWKALGGVDSRGGWLVVGHTF